MIEQGARILEGECRFFGQHWFRVGSPPQWFVDPWSQQSWDGPEAHWSNTREFARPGRDIKVIWELSRFEWAVVLARAFALTRREEFLRTMCAWLQSWTESNPANAGVNWMCGQEVSIRLLRFLESLRCLAWSSKALPAIHAFVRVHLRRIEATLSYALGQNNNHGTSEAAAMFVGGQWLLANGADGELRNFASSVARRGERQLAERVGRLVSPDGTFSQYSLNYHRMLLDTISIVEAWRRSLRVPSPFASCADRVNAAIEWLAAMVEPATGDAPNLGANDGTALLISPSSGFRDHRPTLQLVSCLLQGRRRYPSGPWDDASRYWGVEPEECPLVPAVRGSKVFMPGGYATLTDEERRSWALLRIPSHRFRPSQADGLHFDLWVDGENVIRDTGTYSYNPAGHWHEYFSGTRGHSTCQFDERDQMPRLGRFLFGSWLECEELRAGDESERRQIEVAYTDYSGARHRRTVVVRDATWIIEDDVSGFERSAVVRWHLAPGSWTLNGSRLVGERVSIDVESSGESNVRMVEGWESRAYLERSSIPVLEVVLRPRQARLRTVITLH
ncbi:MAG TPA: alginate lyase family protein [Steroidobacter sp.]